MPLRNLLPAALLCSLLFAGCGGNGANAVRSSVKTEPTSTNGASSKEDVVSRPAVESKPGNAKDQGLELVKGDGNLGSADYGEKRTTVFTIKNTTAKAVNLEVAEKTCACAGVEIRPQQLPPGETATVTLSWVPKIEQIEQLGEMKIKVRARLHDRNQPRTSIQLEANGTIAPALHVHLPRGQLDFGKLDLGQLKAGKKELAVVVYTTDPKHKGFTLLAQSSSPGVRLVPPEPQPLPAGDLQILKAVDGYRINIRVGEGLPIGSFHEKIRLKSNAYENRELEFSVEGYVATGAVSVTPKEVLDLPAKIPLRTGYKCPPMTLTLDFEPNRTLTLVSVEPPFLVVETKKLKENTWRIDVQVPAGREALLKTLKPDVLEEYIVSGFDPGVITFKSDHSLAPVIKIAVPFSQFTR